MYILFNIVYNISCMNKIAWLFADEIENLLDYEVIQIISTKQEMRNTKYSKTNNLGQEMYQDTKYACLLRKL